MFYFYYSCHNFFLLAIYFYTFASLCNNSTNSSMLFGSINLTADFGAGKPYFTNEVCFAAFDASTTFNGLVRARSEEHTSELQSRPHLVCRLLLEKKKKNK